MKTILVIGDSYSAAREGDTGRDLGWPDVLGLPTTMRQALSGSTAAQWAADFEGRLTKARQTGSDLVVMSLLGNDAFAALADGQVTPTEVVAGLHNLRQVVTEVSMLSRPVVVLLYPDPFSGKNPQSATGVPMLNAAIRMAVCGIPTVSFLDLGTVLRPEHFNGTDIHPTRAGHEVIAAAIAKLPEVQ